MSRHLEILRKAQMDAELFSRDAELPNGQGKRKERRGPSSSRSARAPAWSATQSHDEWQQLAHQLFLRRNGDAPRSVGLASAAPGEGTSYVAFHLAAELARATAHPTLLLEANVYRPSLAEQHGVPPNPGLRQVLRDRNFPLDSCVHQTAVETLWLLPAGSAVDGLSPAPDWTNFRCVFESLRERFVSIVADLPPINVSSDAMIIAPLFDAAALVVEAGSCSREAIQNAVSRLRRANPNVMGAVLNKRKFFLPEVLYRRL
jgi:Mrp family chromosome partitioning ATPase